MKKEKVLRVTLDIVLVETLLLLLVPFALGFCPSLGGADYTLSISGRSMNPVLLFGDTVLIRSDIGDIRIGDIISFKANSMIITHRVVKIQEGSTLIFQTKGDANNVLDPWDITADQVLGKVIRIIPTGFLLTPYGLFATVILPVNLMLAILACACSGKSTWIQEFGYSVNGLTTTLSMVIFEFSIGRSLILMC